MEHYELSRMGGGLLPIFQFDRVDCLCLANVQRLALKSCLAIDFDLSVQVCLPGPFNLFPFADAIPKESFICYFFS